MAKIFKEDIKIGNTTFKINAIKAWDYAKFVEKFQGKISTDLKETYEKITGNKAGSKIATTKKKGSKKKSK